MRALRRPVTPHGWQKAFAFAKQRGKIMPMKFMVTVDRDEDGVWVVECPAIPGCVSQGKTKSEALTSVKDAIIGCLQVRAELGMPLTVEVSQVEVAV